MATKKTNPRPLTGAVGRRVMQRTVREWEKDGDQLLERWEMKGERFVPLPLVAIDFLEEVMEGEGYPNALRLRACCEILDRAGLTAPPRLLDFERLTADERDTLGRLLQKAAIPVEERHAAGGDHADA